MLEDCESGVYILLTDNNWRYKLHRHYDTQKWWWLSMSNSHTFWALPQRSGKDLIAEVLESGHDVYWFADDLEMCEELPKLMKARTTV